jgi:hypothetical protein
METFMRATITTASVVALVALVVPAALLAAEPTAPQNAAKACKAERKADAKLFAEMYKPAQGSKKKPFPTCIATKKAQARSVAEAVEDAAKNAAKWCKAERAKNPQAFADTYGTNKNKRNAFGKCVSAKAKENRDDAVDEVESDVKAARVQACKSLRKSQPAAFKQAYKNLGRCIKAQSAS